MGKINENAQKPANKTQGQPITKKHDKGYKRIFSRKRNFLHFLKKYIKDDKSEWINNVDEDDLVPIDTELIDNEFKKRESDIIYRMKLKDRDIIFYVLLELQSSVDFTFPFRLLRYITLILQYIFENTPKNEREAKDYRLPVVIPITLYNGADNWTAVRSFKEYLRDFEQFGEYALDFKYFLFDVNRAAAEQDSSMSELLDIVFMLDKKTSRDDIIKSLNTAMTCLTQMSAEDSADIYDWIDHVWLSHIDKSKKTELMKNFKRGDVSYMNSGLSLLFEEERMKVKKEAYEEKLGIAESLLGVLDVETISKKFNITIEEIENLKYKRSDGTVPQA